MLDLVPRVTKDAWLPASLAAVAAFDDASARIALVDAAGRYVDVSPSYAASFGYGIDQLRGMPWQLTVQIHDHEVMDGALEHLALGEHVTVEVRGVRADGSEFDCEVMLVPSLGPSGEYRGHHHYMRDVSERRASERALRESEAQYKRIIETANEGIWTVDAENRTTFINRRMAEMLGYDEEEMLDRSIFDFMDNDGQRITDQETKRRREGLREHRDFCFRRKDGSEFWALVSATPLMIEGAHTGALAMVTDINDRKRAERELAELALRDSLTSLPNRALLEDRLQHALQIGAQQRTTLAVFFVDIDRFKTVNDTLGHDAGDQVLRAVVPRLQRALRAQDTLARFGGDEFVVLCEDVEGERHAMAIAQRLVDALAQPVALERATFAMSASVGVVVAHPGERTGQDIIRDADVAMYRAKECGGGRFEIFDETMRTRLMAQVTLENDFRGAIDRGEFKLLYQPIVNLADDRVICFEALLRWYHPERGVIAPDTFIPMAERTGLIVPLGEWIVRDACRQIASWCAEFNDPAWARVTVNVSARQLEDRGFPEKVREALEQSGVEAHRLGVELTETALMDQHGETASETLPALRKLGLRLMIDDFGTGYSSLSYLRSFPIDGLKIDGQFIAELSAEQSTLPIVQAVVGMARALGLSLIAEGVEDIDQLRTLIDLGCDCVQGFFYSRPLPPEAVPEWVQRHATGTPLAGRRRAADPNGTTVTVGEAARALDVSHSTLRRWLDDGRLGSHRTSGGHRRIYLEDLQDFQRRNSPRVRLAETSLPSGCLPLLAELLDGHGQMLASTAGRAVYDPRGPGWFSTRSARARLSRSGSPPSRARAGRATTTASPTSRGASSARRSSRARPRLNATSSPSASPPRWPAR